MGYSGLAASEQSSGGKVHRGAITKSGNAHLRRVLVEASWSYHHRPNVTGFLLRRQKNFALSDEVNLDHRREYRNQDTRRWAGRHGSIPCHPNLQRPERT
jgi:transposase